MRPLNLLLFVGFVATLVGCGLNERERAVSDANNAIREVQAASEVVAERIAALPDDDLSAEDFTDLDDSIASYLEEIDALNGRMRTLGEQIVELQPYITDTFLPAAETAATSCEDARDTFRDETSVDEDYRQAIVRIGLCIDRYATAVTNVSDEYDRISG